MMFNYFKKNLFKATLTPKRRAIVTGSGNNQEDVLGYNHSPKRRQGQKYGIKQRGPRR
jgi:hypothetical protein